MKFSSIYGIAIIVSFLLACEPLDIERVTKIKTGEVTEVSYTSATIEGLLVDASDDLIETGHCWSDTGEPNYSDNHAVSDNGFFPNEKIITHIGNLNPDQDYFVRAYAKLKNGDIIYGNVTNFHTSPIPSDWRITIIKPNDQAFWPIGKQGYIEWNSNVLDTFIVELFDESVNNKLDDIAVIPYSPYDEFYSYEYTLPDNGLTVGTYSIRVMSKNFSVYNIVVFKATNPSIEILTPNQESQWNIGRTYDINWNFTDIDTVDILLMQNGNISETLYSGNQNIGLYQWTIPSYIQQGNYQIKIIYSKYPDIFDLSETFLIVAPGIITINSPGNGDTLTKGGTTEIKWSSTNLTSNEELAIELYKGTPGTGTFIKDIASSTANSGTYSWFVPNTISTGTDYYIEIHTLDKAVKGYSTNFEIQ